VPRKKNRRKEIQAAKRAAAKAQKSKARKQVATLGHVAHGTTGLMLAALAAQSLGQMKD